MVEPKKLPSLVIERATNDYLFVRKATSWRSNPASWVMNVAHSRLWPTFLAFLTCLGICPYHPTFQGWNALFGWFYHPLYSQEKPLYLIISRYHGNNQMQIKPFSSLPFLRMFYVPHPPAQKGYASLHLFSPPPNFWSMD
jgi:hypothetical protein